MFLSAAGKQSFSSRIPGVFSKFVLFFFYLITLTERKRRLSVSFEIMNRASGDRVAIRRKVDNGLDFHTSMDNFFS